MGYLNMGPNNLPPGFAEFWAAYPRRVAKGAAAKAWVRNNGNDNLAEILKDLRARVWPSDAQYIPHGATYLNQWRWLDTDDLEGSDGEW